MVYGLYGINYLSTLCCESRCYPYPGSHFSLIPNIIMINNQICRRVIKFVILIKIVKETCGNFVHIALFLEEVETWPDVDGEGKVIHPMYYIQWVAD